MEYPLVLIKWTDAVSNAEWKELDELDDDDLVVTEIGWIIKKTNKYTTICSQFTMDGGFGNRTKIGNDWIKSIQEVKICPLKKPRLSTKSKKLQVK